MAQSALDVQVLIKAISGLHLGILSPDLIAFLNSYKQTRELFAQTETNFPGILDRLSNGQLTKDDKENLLVLERKLLQEVAVSKEKYQEETNVIQVAEALKTPLYTLEDRERISNTKTTFVRAVARRWVDQQRLNNRFSSQELQKIEEEIISRTISTVGEENFSSQAVIEIEKNIIKEITNTETDFSEIEDSFYEEKERYEKDTSAASIERSVLLHSFFSSNQSVGDETGPSGLNTPLFIRAVKESVSFHTRQKNEISQEEIIKEAQALTLLVDFATTKAYPYKDPPSAFLENSGFLKLSADEKDQDPVKLALQVGLASLLTDKEMMSSLNITESPYTAVLQKDAALFLERFKQTEKSDALIAFISHVQKAALPTTGLFSQKDGYGSFLLVRGLSLVNQKNLPGFLLGDPKKDSPLSKEELLFKLWVSTITPDQAASLIPSLKNVSGTFTGFFSQLKENPAVLLTLLPKKEAAQPFLSLYFAQFSALNGTKRLFSFAGFSWIKNVFSFNPGVRVLKVGGAVAGKITKGALSLPFLSKLSSLLPSPLRFLSLGAGAVKNLFSLFTNGEKFISSISSTVIILIVVVLIFVFLFIPGTSVMSDPVTQFYRLQGPALEKNSSGGSNTGVVVVPCTGDSCRWPIATNCGCLTQGVGGSYSHVLKDKTDGRTLALYNAIDIGFSSCGTLFPPIRPTHNGTVIKVSRSNVEYGNAVYIRDSTNSYWTIYAHLSSIAVKQGDLVTPSDIIGYGGSTGNSDGPHLHYERRDASNNFNIGVVTPIINTIPSDKTGFCPGYN